MMYTLPTLCAPHALLCSLSLHLSNFTVLLVNAIRENISTSISCRYVLYLKIFGSFPNPKLNCLKANEKYKTKLRLQEKQKEKKKKNETQRKKKLQNNSDDNKWATQLSASPLSFS